MSNPKLESLGRASDGEELFACTLMADNGMQMRVLNLGGIVQSLQVPDATGALADVVLGYDNAADYLDDRYYFGAIIGRYANRIAGASFVLDGRTIRLTANQGRNHLHGGRRGFSNMRWAMTPFTKPSAQGVRLQYISVDEEEGFPGRLTTTVTYTLTDTGVWDVECSAAAVEATVVNLTQHSYFNLAGGGSAGEHLLSIASDRYLPQDSEQIPTGAIVTVADTGFDLRRPRLIREIQKSPELLSNGLDHSFVLAQAPDSLVAAAELVHEGSGRVLTVSTTAPSLHCYTARYLDAVPGKLGARYNSFDAVCLEAQHFPDSPHHAHFPSTIVRPGQPYQSRTRFAFTTRNRADT